MPSRVSTTLFCLPKSYRYIASFLETNKVPLRSKRFGSTPLSATHVLTPNQISLSYDILSQASTRKAYDANPYHADIFASPRAAEDTFDGVLQALFSDFMSGDFEIIRIVLREPQYLSVLVYSSADCMQGQLKRLIRPSIWKKKP